jgi:ribosomal-protein-alanine N-acetyltransferase
MPQTLHFPDALPALFGDKVSLRELTEDDVPAWFARASDPESAVLAGDPIPESVEMGVQWLQRHRERFRQQAGIRWAIVPKGSTDSVGTIGLTITSKAERSAELGIVIGRANWGKGIGISAAQLVTGYAFSTLGLAEMHAEVLQRNLASRRLLEKLVFTSCAPYRAIRIQKPTSRIATCLFFPLRTGLPPNNDQISCGVERHVRQPAAWSAIWFSDVRVANPIARPAHSVRV